MSIFLFFETRLPRGGVDGRMHLQHGGFIQPQILFWAGFVSKEGLERTRIELDGA